MPAVKDVGEPCAREPHARIDAAAGGIWRSVGQAARTLAPPADPTASGWSIRSAQDSSFAEKQESRPVRVLVVHFERLAQRSVPRSWLCASAGGLCGRVGAGPARRGRARCELPDGRARADAARVDRARACDVGDRPGGRACRACGDMHHARGSDCESPDAAAQPAGLAVEAARAHGSQAARERIADEHADRAGLTDIGDAQPVGDRLTGPDGLGVRALAERQPSAERPGEQRAAAGRRDGRRWRAVGKRRSGCRRLGRRVLGGDGRVARCRGWRAGRVSVRAGRR